MNKKVLIVSPNFFYFSESIATAFRKLGWQVELSKFDTPVHPYNLQNKLKYKISNKKSEIIEAGRKLFSESVKNKFESFCPSLVFIVNGDALHADITASFHTSAKVVIWFFDSIVKYPDMKKNIPFADAVFCYERSDIDLIKTEFNITSTFLPQAADLSRYYKIYDIKKKYDIVFAGDIWQSEKRQRILHKVIESFPEKKILVWGIYKPWYKGIWKWITRERRDIYMNRNVDSETLNKSYNESRIVLNIHNEQQNDGANPKVYEISATGSYQICDANPYIQSLFNNDEIGMYHTDEECIKLIDRALKINHEKECLMAKEKIEKYHTFDSRIKCVLNEIELL